MILLSNFNGSWFIWSFPLACFSTPCLFCCCKEGRSWNDVQQITATGTSSQMISSCSLNTNYLFLWRHSQAVHQEKIKQTENSRRFLHPHVSVMPEIFLIGSNLFLSPTETEISQSGSVLCIPGGSATSCHFHSPVCQMVALCRNWSVSASKPGYAKPAKPENCQASSRTSIWNVIWLPESSLLQEMSASNFFFQ